MKIVNILSVAGFFLTISMPMILHGFTRGHLGSSQMSENRSLAAKPIIGDLIKSPQEYTSAYSAYLEDHFGGRSLFIRVHNKTKIALNGQTTKVIKGTEFPWLFLGGQIPQSHYIGSPYLTTAEKVSWNKRLTQIKTLCADKEIKFLSVKVPIKSRVYSEYFSASSQSFDPAPPDEDLRFDLEVEAALLNAKEQGQTFYKTDTHWTKFGAWVTYNEIVQVLGLSEISDRTLEFVTNPDFEGDLVGLAGLDIENYRETIKDIVFSDIEMGETKLLGIGDPQFPTTEITNKKSGSGKLVIIGDSYSQIIANFFLADFHTVIRVHHEEGRFNFDNVLKHNPDTIIFLPAGRYSFRSLSPADY